MNVKVCNDLNAEDNTFCNQVGIKMTHVYRGGIVWKHAFVIN